MGRPSPTSCRNCDAQFYAHSAINIFCSDACRQAAADRRYRSHRCRKCDRDYLFPAYGGTEVCNDCLWAFEDSQV